MDVLTKKQRSYNMSMIKSKWTSPERKIHNVLKGKKIRHGMHPKMTGSPDIVIPETRTVVFIHGCFWHKCPKHFVMPETKKGFWSEKIRKNVERDKRVTRKLKSEGWRVIKLWEHEIRKNPVSAVKRIIL